MGLQPGPTNPVRRRRMELRGEGEDADEDDQRADGVSGGRQRQ